MTDGPEIHETHISTVMLIGDRAYKLKKAVKLPFVDLSTRERRRQACDREVELNRRLARDVYLGVADVCGPDGAACDHLVVMRRMPAAGRLSRLVKEGSVSDDDLMSIARLLTAFHARANRSPAIAAMGERDAVLARWEAGFAEIQPFLPDVLDPATESEIERLVRRYLAGRAPLFESRVELGRIVDGHGDLLADDIFLLPDGPRVLDCLEFDDKLRFGDVLADVSFLAMDLERLGAPELASRLMAAYRELAGETHPPSLEHHYIASRAHVRAKVACLRGDPASIDEAHRLLDLALAHLRRGAVALAMIGGGPGSGKSTLASGISDRTGWALLRSDEVRKDLAGAGHTESKASPYGEGIYSASATDETYESLVARARLLLERGQSVVLDATWSSGRHRALAAELTAQTSSDLFEIRCVAPTAVREQRVADRARDGGDASDASPSIVRAVAELADDWPTAKTVDTTGPIDATLSTGLSTLGVR